MKKILTILLVLLSLMSELLAQANGSFVVGGDIDKFYPVTFYDGGWDNNEATELTIGRSNVHTDTDWRGSCIGYFRYHTNVWGNSSHFINADITQFVGRFIAGWKDATMSNGDKIIVIWLKGGNTTYFYHANYAVSPKPYDGVHYPLPFVETNGPAHSYKTVIEPYVNHAGLSFNHVAYFNGEGLNIFNGSIAVGTNDNKGHRLAVNGSGIFTKVIVKPYPWSDYVFHTGYRLRPLSEVEQYIQQHHHLPEVPSAEDVENNGLDVGDNQATLLKKIEELTLYAIEQNKKIEDLYKKIETQNSLIKDLQKKNTK